MNCLVLLSQVESHDDSGEQAAPEPVSASVEDSVLLLFYFILFYL